MGTRDSGGHPRLPRVCSSAADELVTDTEFYRAVGTGAQGTLWRLALKCFTQDGKKPWDPPTTSGPPTFNKVFLGRSFPSQRKKYKYLKSKQVIRALSPAAICSAFLSSQLNIKITGSHSSNISTAVPHFHYLKRLSAAVTWRHYHISHRLLPALRHGY